MIYNVNGQVVRSVDQGVQKMGRYTVAWNGKDDAHVDVGSGIYFYSLLVNGENLTPTKRMLYLK